MFKENTLLPPQGEGSKFLRRRDLDPEKRLHIAFMALQGVWGTVTELAREYMISRTFVYLLRNRLQSVTAELFGEPGKFLEAEREWIRKQAVVFALCLRLEGRCSIGSISHLLKRFGCGKYHSVGWVSELLQFAGGELGNTLVNEESGAKLVIMSSDEIFSHLRPILITVDPVSSAILRIELSDTRQVSVWKEHWQCIERNGYCAVYLVNDEGKSMSVAQKEVLVNVIRQSDTFHGVAHRLGAWVDRLENAGYKAIEHAENRFNRLQKAKSDEVIEKKREEYEEAKDIAEKAIEIYDQFHYLYLCLIGTLQVFDRDGKPNDRQAAETTAHVALDLIGELNHRSINKEVQTIRRLVPELYSYLDEAVRIVKELKSCTEVPEEALRALCIAWQYQKSWIKAKQAQRRNAYKSKEREELQLLEAVLGDRFREVKKAVYLELDTIVQSSAMVENINSILRMHLNTTKNHVTQAMLNLFMHYHNHRRYVAGKRKSQTPMEILTGKPQQKDRLELLMEKVSWDQRARLKPAA